MLTRAPGKLIVSGAYAVLQGAPAIVCAVDRYVVADSSRESEFVTPEFSEAGETRPMPWFDATALREGEKKLGLGSSAAILVAALGARELAEEPHLGVEALRERVFPRALLAHRKAQGGGSGADVAASVYGGVLQVVRSPAGELALQPLTLPRALVLVPYFTGRAASTPALLGAVAALRSSQPERHATIMSKQARAAEDASRAVLQNDAGSLVLALDAQCQALAELGSAAGAAIVDAGQQHLAELARRENACLLPAGAGGGDIVLFASTAPPGGGFEAAASSLNFERLDLELGAPGLQPHS